MTARTRQSSLFEGFEADAEARRAAQREFARPLLVEAGAGTGKTATLVARIVAWTLGPGWERASARAAETPEAIATRVLGRVVAITFTEAAAAEMATRLAAALEALARGEVPLGVQPDGLPPRSAWPTRSRSLVGALDHVVVCTIHAFARRLLAAHSAEAGFHPEFEVDADGSRRAAAVREEVEARLARAYEDEDWLALAQEGLGPPQFEEALCAFADASLPADALRDDPFAGPALGDLLADVRREIDAMLPLGARMGALAGPSSGLGMDQLEAIARELPHDAPRDAAGAEALVERLRKHGDDEPERLAGWASGDFKVGERRALAGGAEAFGAHAARLRPLLRPLLRLRPLRFDRARRVLAALWVEVSRGLRARGLVSFDDLLRGARDLLRARPDLAARVRDEIDQLLVDEFQDTDALQGELIERIALDGPPASRPGLFVVGDPKQSIYGWRSADLRAYQRFCERVRAEGGRIERLRVNFRSVPAVLDEVERIARPVMREEAGVQPRFEPLVPAPELARDPGFREGDAAPVEYWVSWPRGADGRLGPGATADAPELEGRALASDVAALHARGALAYRDVALLLRSRSDLDAYLAELRDAGVPYAVEGDRTYYRRREVIEAAALVRCVLDRHDQLSLLAVMRSAAVGVPDAALIPLWRERFPELVAELCGADSAAVERALAAIERAQPPREIPGLERVAGWQRTLAQLVRELDALRASFARDPADTFVERLRRALLLEAGEAARPQGSYRLANLERLFRVLARDLDAETGGTPALLRQLRQRVEQFAAAEEARPAEACEDAVRVLTIHQAKGLDFGHVYLMGVHRGTGRPTNPAEPAVLRHGEGFELRILGAASPGFARAELERKAIEDAERVRTLYVAATRARRRLVIAGAWTQAPTRSSGSHLELLRAREGGVPALGALADELAARGAAHADANAARWVLPALRPGESEPRAPAPAALDLERIQGDAARIRARRAAAETRMLRPFSGAPSAASHAGLMELFERVGRDVAERGVPEDVALAVGGAVHVALQRLDFDAELDPAFAREREAARVELERRLAGASLAHARRLAGELFERLGAGPLASRLAGLRGGVVARELGFLAPPEIDAFTHPVGFVSGAIDLVYRDPGDDRLVVADWKSDRVESEVEIAQRTSIYGAQVRSYAAALRAALALDYEPRAELWFLHPGRVAVVSPR
jgi:ATP-dependent helicase/nuclease subunit A